MACLAATGCFGGKKLPPRIQALLATNDPAVLRLGVYGDPLGVNPALPLEEFGRLVVDLVHAGPLKRGPEGTFQPDLFASYVPTQDEQGNLVVEGAWRNDLAWHDGTPFTSRDFEFTLQAMAASDSGSPYADLARRVTAVQHFDRGRRTRIVFAGNSTQFLDLLTVGVLPSHLLAGQRLREAMVPPASFAIPDPDDLAVPASAPSASATVVPFALFPVGMGPYRLVARQRARFVELEAASGAAAVAPFRRIVIRCFPRLEDLVGAFRNGQLDWMHVPPDIATRLEELRMPGVTFVRTPNPACLVWGFNTRRPPFDRLPVRQALSALINRGRLLGALPMEGRVLDGPPAVGLATMSSGPQAGTARAAGLPTELLTGAGLTDTDGDGWREFEGKPFSLTILTNQSNLGRKVVGDLLVEDLKKVGIRASVVTTTWSDLVGKHLAPGDFDTFLVGFHVPADRSWINLWHSAPPVGERLNFTGFCREDLDRALEAWDRVPFGAPASPPVEDIRALLAEQLPVAWLVQAVDVVAFQNGLQGVDPRRALLDQDLLTWSKPPVGAAVPPR
ncbi:MAG: Oligopeptide ABC transporter, periplasmic oligopeptide-binding protein OppA [Candidatus Ozemobacter sibiricus]|uniref:Oligopeptide ABC transporter, periplasmic oligopeptide-binding protein OppA n=1 Tax=Candidatus Ozemobacter sibiricus TaxID=2268124 RepID=A0A367ZQZ6_9BACT|nr:MAG: Oligopeptide ABC transporter, periplasmic oligopeptide-binding protein OppA [Candidatus Ozemobacter sibiricus]